jgi:hypothetical protein
VKISEGLKFCSSLIFLFRVRTPFLKFRKKINFFFTNGVSKPIVKKRSKISEEISEVSEELKIVSSLKFARSNTD